LPSRKIALTNTVAALKPWLARQARQPATPKKGPLLPPRIETGCPASITHPPTLELESPVLVDPVAWTTAFL
jgi:hypothetical protein